MPCNLEASLQCCGRDHLSVLKFVLVLAPTGPLAHDKAPLKCPLSYFRGLVCRCRVCVGGAVTAPSVAVAAMLLGTLLRGRLWGASLLGAPGAHFPSVPWLRTRGQRLPQAAQGPPQRP